MAAYLQEPTNAGPAAPRLPVVEVSTLGPVAVTVGGEPAPLGTPKQRAVVAALALGRGRVVSVDALIDLLWGEEAPATVTTTLHVYISGLRRLLEPDRKSRAAAKVLITRAPGYALALPPSAFDVVRFEQGVGAASALLAGQRLWRPPSYDEGTLSDALDEVDSVLGLWQGTPYAELGDAAPAVAERARLEGLRLTALESRVALAMALGRHAAVVPDLERLTTEHPLRESLWGLLATALVRARRQADALEALRGLRTVLGEELGIDPGPEIRELQAAILRQDPALEWVPPTGRATPVETSPVETSPVGAEHAVPEAGVEAKAEVEVEPLVEVIGRVDELARARVLFDEVGAGTTRFLVISGDPGSGKTHVASSLLGEARRRGWRVVAAQCSSDDGAPSLWPWSRVLRELGSELPVDHDAGAQDEGAAFRLWERVVGLVQEAAGGQDAAPLVVFLDDLHWADGPSLRVLRLLTELSIRDRLLVVTTWREDQAGPWNGPPLLADVSAALTRRRAARIELAGLDTDAVGRLAESISGLQVSSLHAERLRERTDGNAFFVVEYARLAAQRRGFTELLREPRPPGEVGEVVHRRLARLSQDTVATLRTASVIGRRFDLDVLAGVSGVGADELLDLIEPAVAIGLVRETAPEEYQFAHALVRDALRSSLSETRRARVHGAVARALAGSQASDREIARHWLVAGRAHAGRAWRAGVAAADEDTRIRDHTGAVELLEASLDALARDAEATAEDREAVLTALARALQRAGRWHDVRTTAHRILDVLGPGAAPERVGAAAMLPSYGAVWFSLEHGTVDDVIVRALRSALDGLPRAGALRVRCLLSLACETYYVEPIATRRALLDEATAAAGELGDEALMFDAAMMTGHALWSARTPVERLDAADEAARLARALGEPEAIVRAAIARVGVLGELGLVAEMRAEIATVRAEAERLRLPHAQLALFSLEAPWLALQGDIEAARAQMGTMHAIVDQLQSARGGEAFVGVVLSVEFWSRDLQFSLAALEELGRSSLPCTCGIAAYYLRWGMEDQARAALRERPIDLDHDSWFSLIEWCSAAEVAAGLGLDDLGARAYDLLLPSAGRPSVAGGGMASGPVDAFLALAAHAAGRPEDATAHADTASELCRAWRIPMAAQWLGGLRARHGF